MLITLLSGGLVSLVYDVGNMSWQLLVAISVVTFSVSVILRRILLYKDKSDPIAYVIVFQGLVGVVTGVYALIHGFDMPDFSKYWFAITITCVLYALGNVFCAKALQLVEASAFSVLFASSAIWTILVGSWVLGDGLTVTHIAGISLVLMSVVVLNMKKGSLKLNLGVVLSLITSVLFGLAVVGWTYVARHADVPTWTSVSFLVPALMVLAIKPKAVQKMKPFLDKRILITMLILGVVYSISALTSLFAYRDGNVNLVAALQQVSIILTTVLGIFFLNERKDLLRKIVAACTCLVGVLLIVK